MNKIYKLLITAAALLALGSCTKNFEKYNTDPYAVQKEDPSILLPTMIDALMYVQQNDSQMIDQMVGTLGGYFALANRWGGQNFDTFNASDSWNAIPFNTPFEDIFGNFFTVQEATEGAGHWYALASLVKAAAMMRVTDCYGPIPYSKVKKGYMYVEYDSNEEVYENIIEDLGYAADILYSYSVTYPSSKPLGSSDLLYGGDYAMWARFANSLILRAAVRSGNREAALEAINHPAGLITENSHNALMDPGIQPNPYQLASSSWGDLRANASIVDYMTGYNDPRTEHYFTRSTFAGATDRYIGMRSGASSFEKGNVSGYSLPNLTEKSKLPVFLAAETHFLLAEAALNGWIADDPKTLYETGIRLSMEQYGVGSANIAAYIEDSTSVPASHENDPGPSGVNTAYNRRTTVKIAWDDAASEAEKLEKIITQKWIANWQMGIEAWTEFRRTGYPELCPAIDNLSGGTIANNARGLRRLRYPYTERDLNTSNCQSAIDSYLGGTDNESVDLFWVRK